MKTFPWALIALVFCAGITTGYQAPAWFDGLAWLYWIGYMLWWFALRPRRKVQQ